MEDYDQFVQRRVSCLSNNNDGNQPSSTTSVIRFYGRPILPPLLTEGRRAEMQQHREEAQNAAAAAAAGQRRIKDAERRARLQATLQRQQLCPSPTLEALRHESERNEKSSSSRDSSGGSVLQNCPFTGANESLLFSPPPEEKEKNESHLCATEYEHQLVPPECNGDKDHSFDRHGGFPDNPHLSEELGPNHAPTADLRTWQESTENKSEPNVDLGGVEQSLRPSSELLQESGTRSSPEKNDGFLVPATKSLLVPSPSGSRENEGASAPPLAVTTHSAFNAAPQPEHLKNCLIDQHMGQQVAPTHCLHGLSQSGIHDLEKNTSVSSESVAGKDGDVFGSPDGAYDVGSVFQHSPSNTIAEMPKIICYPPLDGNELERSGLESWFGCGFMISQGISHSLGMPHPSVDGECDPHLYSTASQVYPSLPSPINDNKDHDPELLQSLRTHQLPTVQCDTAVAQSDKAKPPCINLQALLKRSQEYRRHQRMLRSKGKSCEVQKSGELTRAKTDEQSLPDNRSNELLHKSTEATNEGKHNEKESTFIPAEEIKHFWEKHKTTESQFLCNLTSSKSENAHVQEDGGNKEISTIPAETTIENDPVNVSQGVPVKPQQTSSSPHQHREGSRKYRMTRAATFSQSPVYWKSESTKSIRQSEASGLRKDADDNRFNKEQQVHEATFDHQAGSTPSLCTVNHMIVGESPNHAPITSEHIDLIESSLCGLKAQILDLESTLINNLEDHSPTESDMHSDKQHVQLFQSDCAYLGDELSHSVTATDAKCLRRQLLKEMSSAEENPGPEPSNGHDDTLPIRREGPQVVTSGEHRLFQTLNTEETMLNLAYEEEPLPGKGVPHKAQQGQIPEAFQNISPETQVSSNFAHRSNRPEDENEATVGCQYCGQPSHLWLLQGSGSELGSKDHPRLENHLTPEKGGEFQGGVWRIKRRLLTRTKNETDRNSSDDGRGQGSALSGKTWTFTGQRCQKCGQKQSDWPEGDVGGDEKEEENQAHIARASSLQEERSGQQEELLQPGFTPPERLRPLLVAAVKGFLTRRLFKTERVKKLVDVIRDMQQLLNNLQQQNSLRKEIVSLKALLHLSAARSEISEIFFGMSAGARMQIISQDRELIQDRALRQKSVQTDIPRRKSCLSAATQRSLERKRQCLLGAIKSKTAGQRQLKANCASSPRAIL